MQIAFSRAGRPGTRAAKGGFSGDCSKSCSRRLPDGQHCINAAWTYNVAMINAPAHHRIHGRVLMLLAVMILAIAAGIAVSSVLMDRTREFLAFQPFPEARELSAFELTTADGTGFVPDDLLGEWSLLFFGFTNCPDICPDTLALLAEIRRDLDTMGLEKPPGVIFVSVDPERDQGDTLKDYVSWFHPDFVGVTGTKEALEQFTRSLGAVYFLGEPDPDSGYYSVDHSASVMVIDPRGRLRGRFPPPLDKDRLAADLFSLAR